VTARESRHAEPDRASCAGTPSLRGDQASSAPPG